MMAGATAIDITVEELNATLVSLRTSAKRIEEAIDKLTKAGIDAFLLRQHKPLTQYVPAVEEMSFEVAMRVENTIISSAAGRPAKLQMSKDRYAAYGGKDKSAKKKKS
jgi:hypothetical protein